MYAQALGATVATLGGAHGDTGATFVAAGALSRGERRAEEARALVEEGARVARKNAAAAETERDAIVAAGFGALENARRLCDAGASEATDGHTIGHNEPLREGFRITADNHDNNHDLIEHVHLGVETSVAAAEARLRVAELRAGRSFATLALLARDDADTGDARSLTEAESLLRHALACHEGPRLGLNVGAAVGELEGDADGLWVGDPVGVKLGPMVGVSVGELYGAELGLCDGDTVGLADGDSVGAMVGAVLGV